MGVLSEMSKKEEFDCAGVVGISCCDFKTTLEEKYNDWVIENIHVYDLFCKFTLQAIQAGVKKISHWLIVNRIRWEVEIETKAVNPEDFKYKISNDYIAFMARDFIKDYPEHSEIFNIKQMKRA